MLKNIIRKSIGFSAPYINKISKYTYNRITIFLFHDITDTPSEFNEEYNLSTCNKVFEDQISWINTNFSIIHPKTILLDDIKIPKNAAIITFDDGFLGTFENGLKILNRLKIPSVVFINMYAVLEKKPILPAQASYISKYNPKFVNFLTSKDIKPPYYLNLTPQIMEEAKTVLGISSIENDTMLAYQGDYATLEELYKWQNSELVVYANHLFNHWNAKSLNKDQLREQYNLNQEILDSFPNSINLFAFPNGIPNLCFTETEIKIIKQLGAKKVFSSINGVNKNLDDFLLGRLSFSKSDLTSIDYWFRVFRTNVQQG